MLADPAQRRLDVVQLADEIGLRSRSVVQREHAEPEIGEMRVEIAVELLVPIGEPAAVDVYVHRQCVAAANYGIAWDVDVEQMAAHFAVPVAAVRQVGDVGVHIHTLRIVPLQCACIVEHRAFLAESEAGGCRALLYARFVGMQILRNRRPVTGQTDHCVAKFAGAWRVFDGWDLIVPVQLHKASILFGTTV